jgi:hypothetical protein
VQAITANGLPIMLKQPDGMWDIQDLDLCFRNCVIGGPGAVMILVREKAQFAGAIWTKIVREIADRPQGQSLVQPAKAEARANCMAGELRRLQRSGNWPMPGAAQSQRFWRKRQYSQLHTNAMIASTRA